jgi:hypothetical protein
MSIEERKTQAFCFFKEHTRSDRGTIECSDASMASVTLHAPDRCVAVCSAHAAWAVRHRKEPFLFGHSEECPGFP